VPLYNLGNHRSAEQHAEMVRLAERGVCAFCPEHLSGDPAHRPVLRTAHWTVLPNRYPYRGARHHLLLVPDEHVRDMADLSPAARDEFWLVLRSLRDRYALTHYGVGIRNGDARFTGGTIEHLHVHVVVGNVDDTDHEPVRMKLSSRPRREADR
jgi:diadenosine tetraphosphate (Ap4A) HIT family hydrolase